MLEALLEAMRATGIDFAQDAWDSAPEAKPYGTVALEGIVILYADDETGEKTETYAIDLFTHDDGAAASDLVMDALNSMGVAWALNSRVYDMAAGLTHYRFTAQMQAA